MMAPGSTVLRFDFAHRLDAADRHRRAGADRVHRRAAVRRFSTSSGYSQRPSRRAIALVGHHALGEQAGERLVDADMPGLLHRAGEEARIEQMQDRVLDAADILVDRHPVIDRRAIDRHRRARAAEAGEIPRAVDEGVERVGLAPRRPRRSAGRRRASRSGGDRADCPAGRRSRRPAAAPASLPPAPARCRTPRNGSPGSGSPSSAAATRPSRAAAS